MKMEDFYKRLQSPQEKSSLFAALGRLSRLDNLKILAASTTDAGWMYWTEPNATIQYFA